MYLITFILHLERSKFFQSSIEKLFYSGLTSLFQNGCCSWMGRFFNL